MHRVTRSLSELLVAGVVQAASVGDLRLWSATLEPCTAAPRACSSITGRDPAAATSPKQAAEMSVVGPLLYVFGFRENVSFK